MTKYLVDAEGQIMTVNIECLRDKCRRSQTMRRLCLWESIQKNKYKNISA
jgi:CRISPR/Cas system-associated endonuclease Cas1